MSTSGAKQVLSGSPRGQGNRQGRQDLNHLLGFYAAPRVLPPVLALPPRRSTRKSYGIVDKQRFVNAQMRFVLTPAGDYTAHFADPDVFFDWADILQVIIPAAPTCPICLTVPSAGRMSRCGHSWCFGCILHYLALADGTKYRKCPVCYDAIYAKDLKPVKWTDEVVAPVRSVRLEMRLMRRPAITTLALPRSATWPSRAVEPLRTPYDFVPDVITFGKFMLGSPDLVQAALEQDLAELAQEIRELRQWGGSASEDDLGITFVQVAMDQVRLQLAGVEELRTPTVLAARKAAARDVKAVLDSYIKRQGEHSLRDALAEADETLQTPTTTSSSEVESTTPLAMLLSRYATGSSALLSSTAPLFTPAGSPAEAPPLAVAARARNGKKIINPPPPADTTYFFYQAASGQAIYLDALDIRILQSHYGEYAAFPDTIEVMVEGVDEGSMNDELRRKYAYLSHLPTATEVVLVETDLGSLVPPATLEPFSAALKQRRTKRRDRGRREDKAKAKSEQRELEARPEFAPAASSSYVYSSPAYTTVPYAGFLQSANFPQPVVAAAPLPAAAAASTSPPSKKTVWGTSSVAHATAHQDLADYDDTEYDEQWHHFEDRAIMGGGYSNRRGGGSSQGGGGSTGSPATSAAPATSKKGKKAKKLVISLTSGPGGRGTG